MWPFSAVLVSCVLRAVVCDTIYDSPKEYAGGIRRIAAKRRPNYVPLAVEKQLPLDRPAYVSKNSAVSNVAGRGPARQARNSLFSFDVFVPPSAVAEQTVHNAEVRSSPLKVEVPPSKRYYNPATKLPANLERPFPFQEEAGFTVPLGPYALPYLAEVVDDNLYGVLPTGAGFTSYSHQVIPTNGLQSFEPVPLASVSPTIQQFSTRPLWIPRGGTSDFKPQRGNIVQPGSAGTQQVSGNHPGVYTNNTINIADVIRQVEQIITASNQSNATRPNEFKRKFKHPSVGK